MTSFSADLAIGWEYSDRYEEQVEMNLGAPELLILLAIVVLVFGAAKLPKLARSMGQARKEFDKGLKEPATEDAAQEVKDDKKD